ncbi:alanine racemase [Tersicoccus sp. MR15.9]|uniref:alanine racemase n=1 Tax=Tersicoccus mangrovi TaxID=3121635 RepID=UPI002FE60023
MSARRGTGALLDLADPGLLAEAARRPWTDPAAFWPALTAATADRPAPLAVVSAAALAHNAHDVRRRVLAGARARAHSESPGPGAPGDRRDAAVPTIRVGSKSVRTRGLLDAVLALNGYAGVFGYTLAEALHLHAHGVDDVVVGYPTADAEAIARLCADEAAAAAITVMIDDVAQLDLIDAVRPAGRRPDLAVCLDLDLSLDLPGPLPRVGVWRSPLRTPEQVRALAEAVTRRAGFTVTGLLGYEAQIAGVPDRPANRARGLVVRRLQTTSRHDVADRRARAVDLVRAVAPLRFVNGGGSGSVESTAADPSVTEVTVGSALTGPRLFDAYAAFTPAPATAFALDVVRNPSAGRATLLGGGWIASGPPADDRQPTVVWPAGARFEPLEGAGEVQTPLRVPAGASLTPGDRVWLRHAKGGELAEHVNEYLVVDGGRVRDAWPTYRGDGMAFL